MTDNILLRGLRDPLLISIGSIMIIVSLFSHSKSSNISLELQLSGVFLFGIVITTIFGISLIMKQFPNANAPPLTEDRFTKTCLIVKDEKGNTVYGWLLKITESEKQRILENENIRQEILKLRDADVTTGELIQGLMSIKGLTDGKITERSSE